MNLRYPTFLTRFSLSCSKLGTKVDERYLCSTSNISDSIEKGIKKYKNHLSISIMKK